MYVIETHRLGLRKWKDSDKEPFIAMNSDENAMEFFPSTLSATETTGMIGQIKQFMEENKFGLWACEIKQTKEFIGYVGLSVPRFQTDFTPCIEIGWRLAHKYWGYGYATEAALACLDYGFNVLELDEIVSFTSALNTRSINVMKKVRMDFVKNFEHPNLEDGNRLKKHVLYNKKPGRQQSG